ncbi:adenylyltransferase/cytidyltransferase family protein [Candidatus Woesearchaeota archaeon]|nr:adenylyltransferase/cytidyltransferase family protein [Candidatus Woesearchaeota archaeon]
MTKVFCWGTFDGVHKGHIAYLDYAKSLGDYLIVGTISNEASCKNKGYFPSRNIDERAKALEELAMVDQVVPLEGTLNENLKKIISFKPNIFVIGYDQKTLAEKTIMRYSSYYNLDIEFVVAEEFEGGIHSSDIGKI